VLPPLHPVTKPASPPGDGLRPLAAFFVVATPGRSARVGASRIGHTAPRAVGGDVSPPPPALYGRRRPRRQSPRSSDGGPGIHDGYALAQVCGGLSGGRVLGALVFAARPPALTVSRDRGSPAGPPAGYLVRSAPDSSKRFLESVATPRRLGHSQVVVPRSPPPTAAWVDHPPLCPRRSTKKNPAVAPGTPSSVQNRPPPAPNGRRVHHFLTTCCVVSRASRVSRPTRPTRSALRWVPFVSPAPGSHRGRRTRIVRDVRCPLP